MNTNQMIEENNQLRQRLNDENKAYYNDLLLYLRFQSVSRDEAQIESFLLDVLQDILAAQKDGLSAVDYFGKETKEVADAFLAEVPRNFWAVIKLALIAVGSYMGITIFPTLTTTGKPTDVGAMLIAGLYTLLMIMILFKYLAVTIYRVSTWRLHKVMQWLIWCLIGIIALAPLSLITILVKTPVRISLDGIWGIGVILLGWLIGGIVYLRLTDKQMWTPFVIVALVFGIMGIIARIPHFDALLSMKSGRYLYAGLMVIVMIVFYLMSYFAVKKMKKSE
ncbi:hypothetical protein [Leuconostoc lactis]|uniref:hypothetical protein n=1 Tax=Leuconostoc lactis TaxID=1246 RepID=UPI00241C02CA|nr:hypothetical protein [Leuconostoc lactis]